MKLLHRVAAYFTNRRALRAKNSGAYRLHAPAHWQSQCFDLSVSLADGWQLLFDPTLGDLLDQPDKVVTAFVSEAGPYTCIIKLTKDVATEKISRETYFNAIRDQFSSCPGYILNDESHVDFHGQACYRLRLSIDDHNDNGPAQMYVHVFRDGRTSGGVQWIFPGAAGTVVPQEIRDFDQGVSLLPSRSPAKRDGYSISSNAEGWQQHEAMNLGALPMPKTYQEPEPRWVTLVLYPLPVPIFAFGVTGMLTAFSAMSALVARTTPPPVAWMFCAGFAVMAMLLAVASMIRYSHQQSNHGPVLPRYAKSVRRPTFAIMVLLVSVYTWMLTIGLQVFNQFFAGNRPLGMKYYLTVGIAITSTFYLNFFGRKVLRKHIGRRGGRNISATPLQGFLVLLLVFGVVAYFSWVIAP